MSTGSQGKIEELKSSVAELKTAEKLKEVALDKAKEMATDMLKEHLPQAAHGATDGARYDNYMRKKAS